MSTVISIIVLRRRKADGVSDLQLLLCALRTTLLQPSSSSLIFILPPMVRHTKNIEDTELSTLIARLQVLLMTVPKRLHGFRATVWHHDVKLLLQLAQAVISFDSVMFLCLSSHDQSTGYLSRMLPSPVQ